jgi:arylsulfatase A-like enzyme
VRDNGDTVLSETALTLAERARERGLATAAFVSSSVLDEGFGLDQGFALYSAPERVGSSRGALPPERSARATVAAARLWLAARESGAPPFFLWVHLSDPHAPYAPPAEFAGRTATPYLDEIASADHELGRLFDELRARGLFEELFVLVLGDHGEAFGAHGESEHGLLCYEETLRIPLLARWPDGARAGTRSQELVSAVDVAPTLAEALGLEPQGDCDGLSFFARELPAERGLYFESYYGYLSRGWSPIAGWLDERGKYLHGAEPELYDWRRDPRELADQARARELELGRYRAELERLTAQPTLAPAAGDERLRMEFEALGYAAAAEASGPPPPPLAPNTLPAPRAELARGSR